MQPSELTSWLHDTYALGNVTCELLRSYTNDVYLIQADNRRYILKTYAVGWHSEAEIRYEVSLLDHLARKGLHIANAVAGKDGQKVYQLLTSKGEQCSVLFEYAEGQKPQLPFSDALYYAFGQAIARMHSFSDDFATQYGRTPLDLAYLIDRPLQLALPLVEDEGDRVFLHRVAQEVREKVVVLHAYGLDWGPIHGDATLDNLHVTDDNQIILYDFDTGGPGWRASDLQGWAKNNDEYVTKWIAFKAGYADVRELKEIDLHAAPYLAVAWLIWGIQTDLEHRILRQGKEKITAYLQMQIEQIRRQAKLAME